MGRIQRFFSRVQGTDRLIFLLILGYALYLYYQMIQQGLGMFVGIVIAIGGVAGLLTAMLMERWPNRLAHVITGTAYLVMGVYLLTQLRGIFLPLWVYLLTHIFWWFYFAARFWYEGRPYDSFEPMVENAET